MEVEEDAGDGINPEWHTANADDIITLVSSSKNKNDHVKIVT